MSNGAPPPIPVTYIDRFGVHVPAFADVLAALQAQFEYTYGSDIDWDNSTQDSEWIQFLAAAYSAANNMGAAVYNSFSPTNAQGVGLSSLVAINGIERLIPTYSTVTVMLVGQANTLITKGAITDGAGHHWDLPPSVTIPSSGQILVTATCEDLGVIALDAGTVFGLVSAPSGWQSATSTAAAALGAPVEQDGQLRQRQTISASLPALSSLSALEAAIAAISGVTASRVYENDDPAQNSIGVNGKSIAVVFVGGNLQTIIDTIALKKGNGCGTTGTATLPATKDVNGIVRQISLSPAQNINITGSMVVKPGPTGFTVDVITAIQTAVSNWINGLGIGNNVSVIDAANAARLYGTPQSNTFSIVPNSILLARDGHLLTPADVVTSYNELPTCKPSFINIHLLV